MLVPVYASAVTEDLVVLWSPTASGGMVPVRDAEGHALMAPTVEAARRLVATPVEEQPLDARGRMFLRAAIADDLARGPARMHVSPVPDSRAPQAFAWFGTDDAPVPQILRHRGTGRARVWNGATPEDACARAVADLHPVYPDVVTSACPSSALGLGHVIAPPARRVDGPGG